MIVYYPTIVHANIQHTIKVHKGKREVLQLVLEAEHNMSKTYTPPIDNLTEGPPTPMVSVSNLRPNFDFEFLWLYLR